MRVSWWLFWSFAVGSSLFLGLFSWKIHPVQTPGPWNKHWPWYVFQAWFNAVGSLTGWYALWALRSSWTTCLTGGSCSVELTWGAGLHALVAFAGITGHLPWALSVLIGGFIGGIGAAAKAAENAIKKQAGV